MAQFFIQTSVTSQGKTENMKSGEDILPVYLLVHMVQL